EPGAPAHELLVDIFGFGRENVFLEPFQQPQVIGYPSEQDHRDVGMSVDQAGHHHLARGVNCASSPVFSGKLGLGSNGYYGVAATPPRPGLDQSEFAIHRNDGPAADDQIDGLTRAGALERSSRSGLYQQCQDGYGVSQATLRSDLRMGKSL